MSIDYEAIFETNDNSTLEPTNLLPITTELVDESSALALKANEKIKEGTSGEKVSLNDITKDFIDKQVKFKDDVFNLELAKSKFSPSNIKELVELSKIFIVENDADVKKGISMSMQARKMGNAIEKSRKQIVRPHLDFQKAVKQYADEFSICLKEMETSIIKKVETFQEAQELKIKKALEEQRRKEEVLRIEREKKQKEFEEAVRKRDIETEIARKKAEKANIPIVELPIIPMPEVLKNEEPLLSEIMEIVVPQKVVSDDGTSVPITRWVFDIEDETQIPRAFLKVDEKAIRDAVSNGLRTLSGVKIYEKTTRQYRVK